MTDHWLVVTSLNDPIMIRKFGSQDECLAFEEAIDLSGGYGARGLYVYRYDEYRSLRPDVDLSGVEIRE